MQTHHQLTLFYYLLLPCVTFFFFFSSDVEKLKYFQPSILAHVIVMIILIIACKVWLRA